MFGLEHIADEFDKIYESSQKAATDALLVRPGRWSGETFGPDSLFGAYLGLFPAEAWAVYSFAAYLGKSLVDVLRLGEGVKKGTVGGFAEDGIRILNLLPVLGMGAKGVGFALRGAGVGSRFAASAWGASAAGGNFCMSCGATSSVVAMRLSGQRLLITLDEFGNALGKGSPKSANFPGIWFEELLPAMKKVGAGATEIKMPGGSLQTIEGIAAQGKGPVVFGVQWWAQGASGVTQPVRNAALNWGAAEHFLAAFKNSRGAVMVADQFGVRPIAELGNIQGRVSQFTMATRALQFQNVGFVATAEKLIATGSSAINAGGKLTGAANPTLRSWLALSLGIEMVGVSKPVADSIDSAIRDKLGRPPRPGTTQAAGASQAGDPPTGAPASERDLIRRLLGAVNSRTPSDEIFSRLISAGYSKGRVVTVLEEMKASGEVDLVRGPVGNITYVIRRR